MKASTFSLKDMASAGQAEGDVGGIGPQVVFMLGSLDWLRDESKMEQVAAMFPSAACFGCSTAGEISGSSVDDGSLSLMALKFESAGARVAWSIEQVSGLDDSEPAGRRLASGLDSKGLRHVLMVGPGTNVNGSGLIAGARAVLGEGCTLSGGLAVDEAAGSLVLAGDVEPGGYLTLMHANTDGLAIGSESAAKALGDMPAGEKALVAISCVGRKLVMGARVDEEIESLMDVAGSDVKIAGFYSNGEICGDTMANCSLHNQTMTLTMFAEK